jgi:hypothetical protein
VLQRVLRDFTYFPKYLKREANRRRADDSGRMSAIRKLSQKRCRPARRSLRDTQGAATARARQPSLKNVFGSQPDTPLSNCQVVSVYVPGDVSP